MDLLNPLTKKWVEAFVERPKATLLIDCNEDITLGDNVADYIYSKLAKNTHVPIIHIETKEKKSIGIEDIRGLQKSLQLKANNDAEYTRFIIIKEAEKLTPEAQNSLLKLIEELPNKTILTLIAANTIELLETVKSRCFTIQILPITENQALQYQSVDNASEAEIKKAYLLSEGRYTDFIKLLHGENEQLLELIELSKKFIKSSVFERQSFVSELFSTKSQHSYLYFSHALKLTAKSGMRFANSKETKIHWKNILQLVIHSDDQVDRNVSEKLALLSLSVSL